jgi:hypothetical protein
MTKHAFDKTKDVMIDTNSETEIIVKYNQDLMLVWEDPKRVIQNVFQIVVITINESLET